MAVMSSLPIRLLVNRCLIRHRYLVGRKGEHQSLHSRDSDLVATTAARANAEAHGQTRVVSPASALRPLSPALRRHVLRRPEARIRSERRYGPGRRQAARPGGGQARDPCHLAA